MRREYSPLTFSISPYKSFVGTRTTGIDEDTERGHERAERGDDGRQNSNCDDDADVSVLTHA